jgi:hypothetical protein
VIDGNRRQLVRVSLTQDGHDQWECRVQFFDDDTEDRRSGFACRATAHGWAEARIQRHFNLGVPGRLA